MLIAAVPKVGRNCQLVYRTFCRVIAPNTIRPICTTSALSKDRNPAWDNIVPMIMRIIRKNIAEQHEQWGGKKHRHWQDHSSDHDWKKWENIARDVENMFTDGGTTEIIKGDRVRYDGSVFEVKLDIQTFAPEELQVNISGNKLTIKGKHGPKEDEYGSVSREFHRDFNIPEDVNKETFESSISDDGILTLKADVLSGVKGSRKVDIKFEPQKDN